MDCFLNIDASEGGQIFRNSLAFSALTGKAVEITHIREQRNNPGLKRQHLAALNIMRTLTKAKVKGARLDSTFVSFEPSAYKGGNYALNIGSAGSINLLLQSLMLPSLKEETKLRVSGGTDVPFSPTYIYTKEILLPSLSRMSASFSLELLSRGYYPEGNGTINFHSKRAKVLSPITISEKGTLKKISIYSHCASLQKQVALNQISAAKKILLESFGDDAHIEEHIDCRETSGARGSGIDIIAHFEKSKIASNALGIKGKDAVSTGLEAAKKLVDEINKGAPIDRHLADQLIPFAAIAKGKSEFLCPSVTNHLKGAIKTAELFLGITSCIKEEKLGDNAVFKVSIEGKGVELND